MNKQKEKFIIGTQKCPRPPLRLGLPGLPLLLALFILWPTVLCADKWYRDFEKARDAAKAQKWKTVITYIQRALENKPKPNYTAHALAVDVKKYLPYYYLGLANYKLGRFKDADSAFKQTFFYREIESNAQLYAAAKTMAEDCLAKLKLQSQPATVSKPVIRAPKKSQNLRLIKQTITAGDNYSKSGNFAAAGNEYKNAVKLIEESKEAISRLPEVKKKIRSAASAERLEILKISLQNAQRLYDAGQTGDAEKALHKIVRENPGNEKAARLLAHIKNERVKRKKKTLSPALANLNKGITAYFYGNSVNSRVALLDAVKTLERESPGGHPLSVTYQFLAVLYIEAHYLGNDPKGTALNEARRYVDRLYAIVPDFKLETAYFSPRVVTFFAGKMQRGEKVTDK